jgi:cytochrome c oxidase subunit 3
LPIALVVLWWRDVIREAKGGNHTTVVQRGILIGFLLFLLSEVMLFVSFFWAFFHSSLSPNVELALWRSHRLDTWAIPLLGSCVLLASG